jgi:hypothetical protein
MPAVGGPLLGIALARWVRAPWVAPALFLIIVGWVLVADGLTVTYLNSTPALYLRMFAPFTFFTSADQGGVWSWRGSPMAFLGWQLCLCGLAITVALLRDAEPRVRRRLTTSLVVLALLAAVCYTLAVTGGLPHPVFTYPSGSTQAT